MTTPLAALPLDSNPSKIILEQKKRFIIPKIIHLIYLPWDKNQKLKKDSNDFDHTYWKKLQELYGKTYQIMMWTQETLEVFLDEYYPGMWKKSLEEVCRPVQLVDLYRWVVVYHFGGMYIQYDSTLHYQDSLELYFPHEGFEVRMYTESILTPFKIQDAKKYVIRNGQEEEPIRVMNQLFIAVPKNRYMKLMWTTIWNNIQTMTVKEDYDVLYISANARVSTLYDTHGKYIDTLELTNREETASMFKQSSKRSWRTDPALLLSNNGSNGTAAETVKITAPPLSDNGDSSGSEKKGHYNPKVILVTGGAGFIGSNVLCHLVTKYPLYTIICLDKLDYCASTKNFQEIINCPNFKFVKGDILSDDLVNHVIETYKVDTIVNFAAQTHVDHSFNDSISFTKSNVLGTHVLLEASKFHAKLIKRFIYVSTDEVYGESTINSKRMTEKSLLNPTNPYAATKAAAEFLVKSYQTSFGMPCIITRGNNVFGPKQYPEKVIPKFIGLLKKGLPCTIHGNGSNRRSYLHVEDVCTAFDLIIHKGMIGKIYNIGSDMEITNLDIAKMLIELFGLKEKQDQYIVHEKDRAFNDFRYHIDTSALIALGWKRNWTDLKTSLQHTIDWYAANPNNWS